jgi:hypothetical protein
MFGNLLDDDQDGVNLDPVEQERYEAISCSLPEYYTSRPGHCASDIDFPP